MTKQRTSRVDNESALANITGNHLRSPSRVGRAIAIGAGVLLSASILAACAPTDTEAKPTTKPTAETEAPASLAETLEQNIANRPEVGTPEYDALVTDVLRIPYVQGQDPNEVIKELQISVNKYLDMGYADAPQTQEEIVSLMIEESKAIQDIADELNPEYFEAGAKKAWFNGTDSNYGNALIAESAPYKQSHIMALLFNKISPNAKISSIKSDIRYSDATEIIGTSSATFEGSSDPSELSFDLKATDTDDDGSLDSWIWGRNPNTQ